MPEGAEEVNDLGSVLPRQVGLVLQRFVPRWRRHDLLQTINAITSLVLIDFTLGGCAAQCSRATSARHGLALHPHPGSRQAKRDSPLSASVRMITTFPTPSMMTIRAI